MPLLSNIQEASPEDIQLLEVEPLRAGAESQSDFVLQSQITTPPPPTELLTLLANMDDDATYITDAYVVWCFRKFFFDFGLTLNFQSRKTISEEQFFRGTRI